MGKLMKRRIYAGAVLEQQVYTVPEGIRQPEAYDPEKEKKKRFETPESYERFKVEISRRNHNRIFNENFGPTSIYSTLTFDDEWEIHTFEEAKTVRRRYVGALKRKYPEAVIAVYMGRGKTTGRIHFHMVSEGVPEEFLFEKWKYGKIRHSSKLRAHNFYEGKDHGQDYTGLANYLFNHWTAEVGGHRWFITRNARKPEKEKPKEVKVQGGYSAKRPPRTPKGYTLIDIEYTNYGFWNFRYVRVSTDERQKRRGNNRVKDPEK